MNQFFMDGKKVLLITLLMTARKIRYGNITNLNEEHPTMKPLELCGRAISNSSRVGEGCFRFIWWFWINYIASDQLQRKSYGMDRFVDVIVKRYLKHKGSIAECYLIRDGKKIELSSIDEFKNVLTDI